MQYHGFHYTSDCFRHTFISLMMNAEVNLTVIKQIVGHKRIMAIAESGSSHFTKIELIKHVDKIVK